MSKFPFKQVDVFSVIRYAGNPVGVVLFANELTSSQMQQFAAWTNLSETTFVLPPTNPDADYQLRIFTTARELPFAGHPTLGSCHAWLENGGIPKKEEYIIQECGRGLIKLRRGERGLLFFEAPPLLRSGPLDSKELDKIILGLGVKESDIIASAWCDNGVPWRGVLLESAAKVLELTPNANLLGDIDVGVIGKSDVDGVDFEVRAFCPLDSPFEDPVTGSLNAAMAHWLLGMGLVSSSRYVVRQGTAIGRCGIVNIVAMREEKDQGGVCVWTGGDCQTCLDGFAYFDS